MPCVRCGQPIISNPKKCIYYIDYYVGYKRFREKVGPSRTLAETVLKKRQVETAENKHLDIKRDLKIKFDDFAKEYLELHCKVNNKSWQTTDARIIHVLKKHFSGKCLSEITMHLVQQFKADRIKEVAPATVNRQLACLKCLFNKAIAWGKFNGPNPVVPVKMFKTNNQRRRFLEKDEIVNLLAHCNGYLKPIVIVALNTGMRRGEILGLKWRDLDFKRSVIYLHDTKNGEKRELPVNEQVKNTLVAVRKNPSSEYIFCKENGNHLGDIKKTFLTALRKSSIKDFKFHDLRHTFASHLVMSGIDLNTVRDLLGHKSIQMTVRYAHLSPNHKQRAVEDLDKQLGAIWSQQPTPTFPT